MARSQEEDEQRQEEDRRVAAAQRAREAREEAEAAAKILATQKAEAEKRAQESMERLELTRSRARENASNIVDVAPAYTQLPSLLGSAPGAGVDTHNAYDSVDSSGVGASAAVLLSSSTLSLKENFLSFPSHPQSDVPSRPSISSSSPLDSRSSSRQTDDSRV